MSSSRIHSAGLFCESVFLGETDCCHCVPPLSSAGRINDGNCPLKSAEGTESGVTSIGAFDRDMDMSELRAGAETAVRQCLELGADESCVIVTDDKREPIGNALYEVASEISDDVALLRYPPGDQHGAEPPAPVAAALQGADTFLAPTTKSLSHTRARSEATDAGAREQPYRESLKKSLLPALTPTTTAFGQSANAPSSAFREPTKSVLRPTGAPTSRSNWATASGSTTPAT